MTTFIKDVAKNFGRGIALTAFTAASLAACSLASPRAAAQQLAMRSALDVIDTTHQQTPTSASTADLPVMTPELQADVLAARQHYLAAIDGYRKVQPQTAQIENKIAMAYQRLNMREEARLHYARAIKLDRKYAAAYNNLGTMEFHDKDNKHAERLYRRAIKLDAKVPAFWSNLGAAYMADDKYRDGAEAYQRAFGLSSDIFDEISMNGIHEFEAPEDLAKMDLCFAEIFAQAGLKDQAVVYLRKALSEGYHDKTALQQNQQLAVLRGNPEFDQIVGQPAK